MYNLTELISTLLMFNVITFLSGAFVTIAIYVIVKKFESERK